MSNLAVKKNALESVSSNVVYFPIRGSQVVGYSYPLNEIIGNPDFEDYLKDFVEGYIEKAIINQYSVEQRKDDNPFDAIYLAELVPDRLFKSDIVNIQYLANKIIDKSDSIQFNDEWDD